VSRRGGGLLVIRMGMVRAELLFCEKGRVWLGLG
jgi:hypothetical protein